jgi:glutaredoxin-related protein
LLTQLTPALRSGAFRPAAARWLSSEARAALDSAVRSTPVVLFMKGNLAQPQCGFSRAAVQVLEMHDVPQAQIRTFDVLQDQQLRADIKEYSCVRTTERGGEAADAEGVQGVADGAAAVCERRVRGRV